MDLLKQCRQWFEQNEIQKVIDTLEAIPAGGAHSGAGQRTGQGVHRHCGGWRGGAAAV